MLEKLRIQNLAVVEDVTLSFSSGLNVLTGSTGAGKSLILGAVNLLLGERGGAGVIRSSKSKAVVEGQFQLGAPVADTLLSAAHKGSLVLRREVHSNGRSHAFIGGKPCTLKQLQEIARELIEPHGQNEQLQLKNAENHVAYLDKFAGHSDLVVRYQESLALFRGRESALRAFEEKVALLKEKKELLEHRVDEVERAAMKPGEKSELEQSIHVLENAQDIYDALSRAADALYESEESAFGVVSHERARLARISSLNDRFGQIVEQIEQAEIAIKEAAADMRSYLDGFDFDPERLESLLERSQFLTSLERRYGKDSDAILAEQAQWKTELEAIAFEDDERDKLKDAVESALEQVRGAALKLSASRAKAAEKLDRAMTAELGQLMLKGARFRTELARDAEPDSRLVLDGAPVHLGPYGIDVVTFRVRTNPGEAEGSVAEVASSGELSRIALALKKTVSLGREGSVLVFDELDAGVGADLGEMIAGKLAALSESYQIICITHMPQIAARGRHHLVVSKATSGGRTFASVVEVAGSERVNEIARMLGGAQGSEKRLALATEMLKMQEESPPRVRP